MKLTAVIITYNEATNILPCLESLSFCDFFVVVDSGSQDKTALLAQGFGAKVVIQPFLGHVKQKQFATAQSPTDWVLCLDADERVGPELKESILQLKAQATPACWGYQLSRRSFHLGRWIKHGGWYPDLGVRLFHQGHGQWTGYDPHDRVEVQGKTAVLPGDLDHYVFKNLVHNVEKNNFYSTLMALDLKAAGKRPSLLKLLFKPPFKFVECYLIKRGFLDGLPGFIIAVGAGYSMFLKFAKLWEAALKDETP